MKIDFKNIDWENVVEEAAHVFVTGMIVLFTTLVVLAMVGLIILAPIELKLILGGFLTFVVVTGSIARFVFGFRI